MENTFRSRISVLLLLFIVIVLFGVSIPIVILSAGHFDWSIIIPLIASFLLVMLIVFVGARYTIREGILFIRTMGIISARIDIADIASVKRSYNPLSAPAMSLKRLAVRLNPDSRLPYCLISPAHEEEFLAMLKKINPKIDIQVNNEQKKFLLDWDL